MTSGNGLSQKGLQSGGNRKLKRSLNSTSSIRNLKFISN